ncbi:hypothetical protein FOZ60_012461 [Perkinsus olseni]|uniref:Uncharacterized protein n=1 Tax=Perkinsus olseni TaxID=32597 RepID=A0A7J6RD99_PEROL|nr:hypothetical protein FOZ60_012461 [Perkinsus olseni]KAF4718593.1 hypothetical protein FOZ62_020702 [Perkinsus olseni]
MSIIILLLSLTSALLFGLVEAQPAGRFELKSAKYNVIFGVSEGKMSLHFGCNGQLVLVDTGYPSNGLKLLPIGDNSYTFDFSQSLSSIDSWYTQIETGCPDVRPIDGDLATISFVDDDNLSTSLEGQTHVLTRSTLTLSPKSRLYQYTDGDFELLLHVYDVYVSALVKCSSTTQETWVDLEIFEDRTSKPYLVYSVRSSSSEMLKDRINQECSIPLQVDDLSYFAVDTSRTLFTQFKGVRIHLHIE